MPRRKIKQGRGIEVWGGVGTFSWVAKNVFTEDQILTGGPEGSEGASHVAPRERTFWTEGTAHARAPRWE